MKAIKFAFVHGATRNARLVLDRAHSFISTLSGPKPMSTNLLIKVVPQSGIFHHLRASSHPTCLATYHRQTLRTLSLVYTSVNQVLLLLLFQCLGSVHNCGDFVTCNQMECYGCIIQVDGYTAVLALMQSWQVLILRLNSLNSRQVFAWESFVASLYDRICCSLFSMKQNLFS